MESFFNQLKSIVSKSETFSKVVVLGKGSSADLVDKSSLTDAFVITLNDAEKIFKGNLCLYHHNWALDSIQAMGLRSDYYVSNKSNIPNNDPRFIGVDYELVTFDSLEKYIADYSQRDFVLTDFLLLSAIKISGLISQILNKKLDVYLLGFDFAAKNNGSNSDPSGHGKTYKNALFATQKAYLSFVKNYINELGVLNLFHVGSLDISDLSVDAYNLRFSVRNNEKGIAFNPHLAYQELLRKVKEEGYVINVAEFTNNHLGDEDRLRKMVAIAKESGADMIKVQKREVDSFYSSDELKSPYKSPFGDTLEDYRKGVELDDHLFQVLISECNKHQILWFASILDYPSLQYMEKYNPFLIKLPSTISNHRDYILKVAKEFKGDVVISTGFTDKAYEQFVLDAFLPGRNLFLLQCTSSYPAPPEACQLGVVRHYDHLSEKDKYQGLIPGYSSHDIGSQGCMMAVAAGAKMVEKHVKLGNVDWVHFDGVALDLLDNQFKNFSKDIRKATLMTGSKEKRIHHQEHHKYKVNK